MTFSYIPTLKKCFPDFPVWESFGRLFCTRVTSEEDTEPTKEQQEHRHRQISPKLYAGFWSNYTLSTRKMEFTELEGLGWVKAESGNMD